MKSALYSPYLDSLGGGERYMLTIAEYLAKKGEVTVFWDDEGIKAQAQERFGLDLSRVAIQPDCFSKKNLVGRYTLLKKYDVFVFLSDGSFPFGSAKRNILHFQHPFTFAHKPSAITKIKLATWQEIICNAAFTKTHIDKSFGVTSKVVYPPVAVESFAPVATKQNQIISVGRFVGGAHGKKQEILVEAFKKLVSQGVTGWQLILAGSIENQQYYDALTVQAQGAPIQVMGNVPFSKLIELYAQSKIYWHAQGFGEHEPQYMEHFGITTVEAMASGCVPVVFDGGGQREIVKEKENGLLWQTQDELLAKTRALIDNEHMREALSQRAVADSRQFSKLEFYRCLDQLGGKK